MKRYDIGAINAITRVAPIFRVVTGFAVIAAPKAARVVNGAQRLASWSLFAQTRAACL
ncbi:hypothetical protein [Paraburkholderia unamae]|uniref:hypothetical protein n=1 Tax=Paraburkholderia unamae TaxID=219649 RepID=UPI0014041599|nr:hypothetical protein [Paraburkholderia unamae]CAG9244159.1 hypothetical protein PUN4_100124 [Paraburkholderia unamae]